MTADERRHHTRIRLRRKVGIVLSTGQVAHLWSHDVSVGGLRVLSESPADPGDEFDIFFGMLDPAVDAYVRLDVRVRIVHVIYDGTAGRYRIGMRFLGFSGEGEAVYQRGIDHLLRTQVHLHAG